jgi:RNA polymerase sigma-70 factor (ECF subfamily)
VRSARHPRRHVSRARKHLDGTRRAQVDATQVRTLLEAFLLAARAGDVAGLERILAEDVVSVSDGAGMVARAARRPVSGRNRVARFVAGFAHFFWTDTTVAWLTTNGAPSVLISHDGEPVAVLSIDATAEGIEEVRWVMVPDKLTRLRS